jgi:hypothetical protein
MDFGVITWAITSFAIWFLHFGFWEIKSLAGLLLEQHTLDYSESGNIKHITVGLNFILIVIHDVRALHSTR